MKVQRKGERADALGFAKGVVLKHKNGTDAGKLPLDKNTMVRDVSVSGVAITTDSLLGRGDVIQLSFYLPGTQAPIKLEGRAIRGMRYMDAMGGKYGYALHITEISEEDKGRIQAYVAEMEIVKLKQRGRKR